METISKEDIKKALTAVGLDRGQVVFTYSDLSKPGRVENVQSRDEFCQVYLDSILKIIGSEGTLVVPTYTTQVARFDIEFVWEETPTPMGVFSEFVRCHPESLRSVHPINSVCAIGADKEFICSNNGTNNFGWASPFQRMLLKKAKILTIGLESGYVVGIAHHLEAACCLPYVYNKLLKWSPIVNGEKDTRQYFATLRYLDLDVKYDLTAWVKHMRRLGGVNSVRLGGSWVHFSDYERVFTEGAKMLKDNPYCFLKTKPNFKYGQIPFDGPTAQRDDIAGEGDINKVHSMNWTGYYLMSQGYAGGDEDDLE